eukprot:Pgem_evm1s3488
MTRISHSKQPLAQSQNKKQHDKANTFEFMHYLIEKLSLTKKQKQKQRFTDLDVSQTTTKQQHQQQQFKKVVFNLTDFSKTKEHNKELSELTLHAIEIIQDDNDLYIKNNNNANDNNNNEELSEEQLEIEYQKKLDEEQKRITEILALQNNEFAEFDDCETEYEDDNTGYHTLGLTYNYLAHMEKLGQELELLI